MREKSNLITPQDSIQLVSNAKQSFIQVKYHTGQNRIVSRYGTGDSALKQGQTVYKDLQINNGALSQASDAYQLDADGGKVLTNRSINVNPNRLVATREAPTNQRVIQDVLLLKLDQITYNYLTSRKLMFLLEL